MNTNKPDLSVVSPCLNEEDSIRTFVENVKENIIKVTSNYEIIIVDDGSADNTWSILKDLKIIYGNKLKAIKLTRNFGHQKAILCGIRKASGLKILTMDSDLEHPPSLIPTLYKELLKEDYEIISCTRKTNIFSIKYFLSNIFYFIFNNISKNKINKNVSDFKIFNQKIKNDLNILNEKNIFLRGIIPWLGYKEKLIEYSFIRRQKGKSKLGLKQQLSFSFDGIFNFSYFPRRFSFYISFFFLILTILSLFSPLLNLLFLYNLDLTSLITPFIFITLFFIFFVLGIISEYMARILEQTQNRPDYVIKKEL